MKINIHTHIWTGFITSLIVCVGIVHAAKENPQSFSDVPPTHSHYDAIEFLTEADIVSGYEDGTFKPDGTINRAEAMKLVVLGENVWFGMEFSGERIAEPTVGIVGEGEGGEKSEGDEGSREVTTPPFTFSDFEENSWFSPYVYNAYDRDIIRGYEDGTFRPGNNINKAEALKIVLLTFTEGNTFPNATKNPFPDVPFGQWFAPYVKYAKDTIIIEPDQFGKYNPGQDITRGEFAEMVYRLLYMAEHEQGEFDPSVNWEIFNRSLQGYLMKSPPGWEVFEEKNDHPASGNSVRTIFWHKDEAHNQRTYMRQFPNSATAEIVVRTDPVDVDVFFGEIRNVFGSGSLVIETETNGMRTLVVEGDGASEAILDAHIAMPDGHVASIYGTYGYGPLSYKNAFYLRKIRENFEYTERSVIDDTNIADIMTIARQNVQVDGVGTETLQLFDDLLIIETDTIGVGTGPVDYYYSKKADATLKHERSFDVILDIEDGETSKF